MNDLMNKSPASGLDVHHQSVMRAGIVAIRRCRLFAEEKHSVLFVRSRILEQPDVENLFRVLREILLLEFLDSPLDGALGMLLHGSRRFVANHYEWWLHDDSEIV